VRACATGSWDSTCIGGFCQITVWKC
jgi:hypothetical protein